VEGVSGGLGGGADRAVYLHLRSLADAVLVGAGTVRAERYGPPWLPLELVEDRRRRGQPRLPRIAVASRSCRLDWESPFFGDAASRPIVITVADAPAERRAEAARVADVLVAGDDDVDLDAALAGLAAAGARSVLAEGGPTLNGALASAGLLDELCLTLSPLLVGGDARRILAGAPPVPDGRLELEFAGEEDGFLFLRYRAR
jgi:riboflavin biosynthesis pyrimidine reductase